MRGPWRPLSLVLAFSLVGCSDEAESGFQASDGAEASEVWANMPTPGSVQLLGVWGRSDTEAYAVGWDGTALRYDGLSWRVESTSSAEPLTDVSGGPTATFAVGWAGTVLQRDAGGQWSAAPTTSTTSQDLFGVHMFDDAIGLAVGDAGTVLRWDGAAWTDIDFQITSSLSGQQLRPRSSLAGVFSADGQRWIVAGAGGAAFESNDGGMTFSVLETEESIPLRGVWSPRRGVAYVVGLDGVVLSRRANSLMRELAGGRFLFGVWGRDNSDVTVVGWQGTVLRRFEGAWFPEASGTETDLRDVWVDAPTGLSFAVGAAGTIIVRTSTAAPEVPSE